MEVYCLDLGKKLLFAWVGAWILSNKSLSSRIAYLVNWVMVALGGSAILKGQRTPHGVEYLRMQVHTFSIFIHQKKKLFQISDFSAQFDLPIHGRGLYHSSVLDISS